MTGERREVVHLTDGDKHVFDSVRITSGGWISCRLRGSDMRTRFPPHRVERVVGKEVSHDD